MTLGRGSAASFYQDHSRDHVSTVWGHVITVCVGSCEHSVGIM